MSHHLDLLLGQARRAECLKNDAALAHGVTHTRQIVARGNHLAAQNDEPEPTFRDIEAKANADARAIVRGMQP